MNGSALAALLMRLPTAEAARRIGVRADHVSRWRMGRALPQSKHIDAIAVALWTTPEVVAQAIAADKVARLSRK